MNFLRSALSLSLLSSFAATGASAVDVTLHCASAYDRGVTEYSMKGDSSLVVNFYSSVAAQEAKQPLYTTSYDQIGYQRGLPGSIGSETNHYIYFKQSDASTDTDASRRYLELQIAFAFVRMGDGIDMVITGSQYSNNDVYGERRYDAMVACSELSGL